MYPTAPLQPAQHSLFFPPIGSSSSPESLLPPSSLPPAPPQRPQHRHSKPVMDALELLRRLADQVERRADRGGEGSDEGGNEGIISNLERAGWVHSSTTNGIRIFSSQDPNAPSSGQQQETSVERRQSVLTTSGRGALSPSLYGISTPRTATPAAARGLRADETLPFFRGEGWIDGPWRREDVVATITSIGARSVWDPRLDASKSEVVEHLSNTDSLSHLSIRGTVSDRDAAVVTACAQDERRGKENVTYVASTSVVDALIPKAGTRTFITLNGFAIRTLPRPPAFEATSPPPLDDLPPSSPPARPAHRRTRSTMSAMHSASALLGTVPLPPLPGAPNSPPGSRPQPFSSSTHVGHTSMTQQLPRPSLPPRKRVSASASLGEGAGLHVSMIVRAAPGYNLPGSVVEQLSVHLPLAIHSVSRFLTTHGFAPHLVRTSGVKLREECYKPITQDYRVVFSGRRDDPGAAGRRRDDRDGDARIRFHGFGRDKVDIELQNVDPSGFSIEYDGGDGEELSREVKETGGVGFWRTRLSVATTQAKSGDAGQGGWNRRGSAASLVSPISTSSTTPFTSSSAVDGATLIISSSAIDPFLPVTVTISRPSADSTTLPLKAQSASAAFAVAAKVLENPYSSCDSVEELLECGREGSEENAEMLLKGARQIVTELEKAHEREAYSSAPPFSPSWGRVRSSSRRSRSGGPGSIVLNSPFAASGRDLPLSPQSYFSRLP